MYDGAQMPSIPYHEGSTRRDNGGGSARNEWTRFSNDGARLTQPQRGDYYTGGRVSQSYSQAPVGLASSASATGRSWAHDRSGSQGQDGAAPYRTLSTFLPSNARIGQMSRDQLVQSYQPNGPLAAAYPSTTRIGENSATRIEDADQQAGPAQQPMVDRRVSCLECRSSKVKCTGPVDEGSCSRCRKGGKQCVFQPHSRGRKRGQTKLHSIERIVEKLSSALNDLTEGKYSAERSQMQEALSSAKTLNDLANASSSARKRSLDSDTVGGSNKKSRDRTTTSELSSPSSSADLDAQRAEEGIDGGIEPDIPTEALGQPALSNPLKLLAHASDVALAGSNNVVAGETVDKEWVATKLSSARVHKGLNSGSESAVIKSQNGSNVPATQKSLGASQHGYWDMGIYSSRPDKGTHLDPISVGILSKETARTLFDYFMRHLNAPITLLDPALHTFEYVQIHSAFLLSAACALAARFTDIGEKLARDLDAHIQEVLLPAVLLRGYRSVEIAQAFVILAAYHTNTQSLDGDRSWSLVGYGIRIAAELDMNARIMSRLEPREGANSLAHTPDGDVNAHHSPKLSVDELVQRRLRNRERTWCNLWLYDFSLSTHMGRRSTLGQDPVILGVSAGWQRAPYAIPGDEAIVALIGLRRIQLKNAEFFDHTILSNASALSRGRSAALGVQLDFYNRSCASDIDSWKAMYADERGKEYNFRTNNLCLYASYARLMLNSYVLKCTKDADLLAPFYKESYCAVMTYLTLYAERMESHGLTHVHNSSVVTVAYVAVFALKLCSLDRKQFPYIDVECVYDHVRRLVQALHRAGSVTPWRNGAASSYAPYLAAILSRVARSTQEKGQDVEGSGSPSARDIPHNKGGGGEAVQNPARAQKTSMQSRPASSATVASKVASPSPSQKSNMAALETFELEPFHQESLGFVAGPSGVGTYTIDEIAFPDVPFHFGDLQHPDNLGFNEASLFNDMSVFLNAAFSHSSAESSTPWSIPTDSLPPATSLPTTSSLGY